MSDSIDVHITALRKAADEFDRQAGRARERLSAFSRDGHLPESAFGILGDADDAHRAYNAGFEGMLDRLKQYADGFEAVADGLRITADKYEAAELASTPR